jgi:plastocyanin
MARKRLILAPLTTLAALGVAAPATAVDLNIAAADYQFTPVTQNVAVGDRVVWSFDNDGHTTTSKSGQAESWDSKTKAAGSTFAKTFTKPGRYQYICVPHQSFGMKGTIVVGEDTVADTVDNFKTKVSGTKVTVSFKLNEPATAGYKVTGASKRTVKAKRLKAGKHSITVKGLKAGSYKGTLSLSDDFDKKTTEKKSFKVG